MGITRAEHLEWCKKRALEYVEAGEMINALASMGSDLNAHQETKDHPAMKLGLQMMMVGLLSRPEQMRKFILGFH
jgi:hypothetical protein